MPVQSILTLANGEILYKPFISMCPNFLNLGALRLVSRIGIKAKDNNKEININGSYFSGLLKFNKSVPIEIPIKVIISEYLKVADFFVQDSQKGFLNAILDKASRLARNESM